MLLWTRSFQSPSYEVQRHMETGNTLLVYTLDGHSYPGIVQGGATLNVEAQKMASDGAFYRVGDERWGFIPPRNIARIESLENGADRGATSIPFRV